jgi:hypothetical protein
VQEALERQQQQQQQQQHDSQHVRHSQSQSRIVRGTSPERLSGSGRDVGADASVIGISIADVQRLFGGAVAFAGRPSSC